MATVDGDDHHLVSKSYQRSWADGVARVAIIGTTTANVIEERRPIKRNWTIPGFNTFDLPDGQRDSSIEDAFSKIETFVLPAIRSASSANAGPEIRANVANLFALHLVRSRTFRQVGHRLGAEVRDRLREQVESDDSVRDKFRRQFGREPLRGELAAIVDAAHDEMRESWDRDSMARMHDQIGEKLNSLNLQVVEIVRDDLPGFVLGDLPIVHAHLGTQRFGFADRLAVGDADLIGGPLTPRIAAFFTHVPLSHARVTTKRLQQAINAYFIRGAAAEVACRTQDTRHVQHVVRNLDRHLADLSRHLA